LVSDIIQLTEQCDLVGAPEFTVIDISTEEVLYQGPKREQASGNAAAYLMETCAITEGLKPYEVRFAVRKWASACQAFLRERDAAVEPPVLPWDRTPTPSLPESVELAVFRPIRVTPSPIVDMSPRWMQETSGGKSASSSAEETLLSKISPDAALPKEEDNGIATDQPEDV
jgi:hypothetical protein